MVLRQYEGSTPKFLRSKYILAQTTKRQQKDNLDYIYIRVCDTDTRDVSDALFGSECVVHES